MPKFEVTLLERVSYNLVVEAGDYDDAGNVAEEIFVQTDISRLSSTVHQRTIDRVAMAGMDTEPTVLTKPNALQDELLAALKRAEFVMSSPSILHLTNGGGALDVVQAAILKAGGAL